MNDPRNSPLDRTQSNTAPAGAGKPTADPGKGADGGAGAKAPVRPLKSGMSIVPSETIAGTALVFVIGIMAFLACLTLGAVSLINSSANQWQSDISREVTIQIRPSDEVGMEDAIKQASRIALSFAGVSRVEALDDDATVRLLEPWLGTGLQLSELPVPRILTVTLAADAKPDFEGMRSRLESDVPGSSLDDHRAWVDRLTTMAWTMVAIGTAIFLLVMAATVTTVIFATRGAMAGNKDVVEVLHFVGADGRFIAAQFQKHFLVLGLKGALCGAVAAIFLFLVLGVWSSQSLATPEGDQISALFGTFSLSWSGYFGMLLVMVFVSVMTAMTSSWTVRSQVNLLQDYRRAS
ncbi:MAG: ABC transporter permease [Rhizobiaceae bacterium]|nr:ABC transporter permease [Rhizobiaceae bacterium]